MDSIKILKKLLRSAENGDRSSVQLSSEVNRILERYKQGQEQELTAKIAEKFKAITNICASSDFLTNRDPSGFRRIKEFATQGEQILIDNMDVESEEETDQEIID